MLFETKEWTKVHTYYIQNVQPTYFNCKDGKLCKATLPWTTLQIVATIPTLPNHWQLLAFVSNLDPCEDGLNHPQEIGWFNQCLTSKKKLKDPNQNDPKCWKIDYSQPEEEDSLTVRPWMTRQLPSCQAASVWSGDRWWVHSGPATSRGTARRMDLL
jgi:hypothetical protein